MKTALLFVVSFIVASMQGHALDSDDMQTRLEGGTVAGYGEFPFAVALLNLSMDHEVACGGAIVNENYIVTSAACMEKYSSDASIDMYAVLGASYLILNGTRYGISSVTIHEEYNRTLKVHDIAVARLNQSIVFTDVIQPAKLPDDSDFTEGNENVTEIGYGWRTPPLNYAHSNLLKLSTNTMDTAACRQRFRAHDIPIFGAIHLCVENNAVRKGLCRGDYGSPLVQNGTLVGLASFNIPCGQNYPDVFTRTSYYTTWIEVNTQPDLK